MPCLRGLAATWAAVALLLAVGCQTPAAAVREDPVESIGGSTGDGEEVSGEGEDEEVTPPAITGGLRFEVTPPDAQIIIDGQSRGPVTNEDGSPRQVALPPGLYQVALTANGHATWRAEVAVQSTPELIRVALEKR